MVTVDITICHQLLDRWVQMSSSTMHFFVPFSILEEKGSAEKKNLHMQGNRMPKQDAKTPSINKLKKLDTVSRCISVGQRASGSLHACTGINHFHLRSTMMQKATVMIDIGVFSVGWQHPMKMSAAHSLSKAKLPVTQFLFVSNFDISSTSKLVNARSSGLPVFIDGHLEALPHLTNNDADNRQVKKWMNNHTGDLMRLTVMILMFLDHKHWHVTWWHWLSQFQCSWSQIWMGMAVHDVECCLANQSHCIISRKMETAWRWNKKP